ALARYTPFGYNNDIEFLFPEGTALKVPETGFGSFNNIVTPGYFATVRQPILAGRDFTDADDASAPKVVIVTRRFAEMHWPGQSAIGRRVRLAPDGPVMEVVGVAGDIQYFSIGEAPKPFFFHPYGQWYRSQMTINVLGSATPAQLTLVRDAVSG